MLENSFKLTKGNTSLTEGTFTGAQAQGEFWVKAMDNGRTPEAGTVKLIFMQIAGTKTREI